MNTHPSPSSVAGKIRSSVLGTRQILARSIFGSPLSVRSRIGLLGRTVAILSPLAMISSQAAAASVWWDTTDGNWDTAGNWWTTATGTVAASKPVAGDTVTFNGTGVNGVETIYLNGNQAAATLTFANSSSTTLLGGNSATPANNTLTLSAGISVSSGAGAVTIGNTSATAAANLAVSANQNFNNLSSNVVTVNSGITSSAAGTQTITLNNGTGTTGFTFNGVIGNGSAGGTLAITIASTVPSAVYTFNNTNTFSGGLTLAQAATGQTVIAGADNAFGAGITSFGNGSGTGTITVQAANGARSFTNDWKVLSNGYGKQSFSGSNAISISGAFNNNSYGFANNISGAALTLSGNVYISNTDVASQTATLSGTGNTVITGAIKNNAAGTNTNASNLTIWNTGLTTLGGANTFTGTLTLGSSSIVTNVRLANANALGSGGSLVPTITTYTNSALIFASDSTMANTSVAVNAGKNNGIWTSIGLDRASAGAAVDQTIGSLVLIPQSGLRLFKGGNVTSGSPSLTVSGNTTFAGDSTKISQLVANDGANFVLNNLAPSGVVSTARGNTLYLDGSSTGNKIQGVIANGVSLSGSSTPTWTGASGSQTVTVSSATGLAVWQRLTGIPGIADGTVITGISGTTITLSAKTTSSVSGQFGVPYQNIPTITKVGSGSWALQGANTYTGSTTVAAGTLNVDFANSSTTSDILYNGFVTSGAGYRPQMTVGGTLKFTGKASTANTQALGSIASSAGYSGSIVLSSGAGGTMTVNATTFAQAANSMTDFTIGSGATLNFTAGATGAYFGSRGTVNGSTDFAWLNGAGGNVIAAGSNISTTLTESLAGSTTQYATLTGNLTRTADGTIKGLRLIGTGSSDGTLNLGGFQLNAAGNDSSTFLYAGGGNNNYNLSNGKITSSSTTQAAEAVFSVASGATLNLASDLLLADNTVALSILKSGDGTVTVTGAKSYTGATRLLGGVYSIDTLADGGTASSLGAAAATSGNLNISGGTLKYTGSANGSTNRIILIGAAGATLDASGVGTASFSGTPTISSAASSIDLNLKGNNTNANTFSGVLANGFSGGVQANGYLTLTKSGIGTWVLSGANSYSGGTYVNGGVLAVANASALGSGGSLVFGGGTLQYSGIATDFSLGIKNSTSAIKIDTNGQAVTFASAIDPSNSGGLTLNDTNGTPGSLTLSAANSYTGATTISAGTLVVNGSLPASSAVSVSAGATLSGGGTVGATTINGGTINGSGLTLTGNATFTGAATLSGIATVVSGSATVSSGNLLVSGRLNGDVHVNSGGALNVASTLNGTATIDAGATLTGVGTLSGLATVRGTIAPGTSGIGTLTAGGGLSLADNSTLSLSVTGTGAGQYGKIAATSLSLGNNVNLSVNSPGYDTSTHYVLGDLAHSERIYLTLGGYTSGAFANVIAGFADTFFGATYNSYTDNNGHAWAVVYGADHNTGTLTGGADIALIAVPEPSTWAMLVGGFGLLTFGQRLRRRRY